MKIGLIDVDGHHYPNLALMKISAYHKAKGDSVEWWWGFEHYDRVYMSKVFDDTYSPDIPAHFNADQIVRGGTGYCMSSELPYEIEHMLVAFQFVVQRLTGYDGDMIDFTHVLNKLAVQNLLEKRDAK